MNARAKQTVRQTAQSSFETVLDETLRALYERRSEINNLLRSLKAEKRGGLGQQLKIREAAFKRHRQVNDEES